MTVVGPSICACLPQMNNIIICYFCGTEDVLGVSWNNQLTGYELMFCFFFCLFAETFSGTKIETERREYSHVLGNIAEMLIVSVYVEVKGSVT